MQMRKKLQANGKLSKERVCAAGLWMTSLFLHLAVINHFVGWFCTDTAGYWLHAATFTGHDWSEAAKTASMYYSWGYSLWLVIPFLLFPANMALMAKTAIVINALFCSLTFVFSYLLGKNLFSKVNRQLLMVCAFLVSIYPTYILEASVALAESLLFFLHVLQLWLIAAYLSSKKVKWAVLSGCCCGYMYIVHHRTLGVAAAFLCMLFVLFLKNRDWKEIIAFMLPLVLWILAGILVDHWLLTKEMGGHIYTGNTYRAMAKRLPAMLRLDRILSMVQNTVGQAWYILAGTYTVAGLGILSAGKKIYHMCFGSKHPDRIGNAEVLSVFAVLSLVFSIGISVFATAKQLGYTAGRMDSVFYGRYFENVLGIFLLAGLTELSSLGRNREMLRQIIFLWILTAGTSVAVHYFTQMIDGNGINYFSVTAVLSLYGYPNLEFSVLAVSLYSLAFIAVVMYLFSMRKRLWKAAAYCLLAGGFLYTGYSAVVNVDHLCREHALVTDYPTWNEDALSINQYIKEHEINNFGVYQESVYAAFSYQLMNPQRKVYAISSTEDIVLLQSDISHVIVPQYLKETVSYGKLEMETAGYAVYKLDSAAENMSLLWITDKDTGDKNETDHPDTML